MASVLPGEIQDRLGTIEGEVKSKGPRNTLSVCMIVKNEEANIERAIRSFLPFADEIIVNDTGSTDRTLELLAKLPKVKVIHSEWKRDFSYSRNLSLEQATCGWILWMDADDVVPAEQAVNFSKLKHAPMDRAFGFQVINTQAGGKPVGAHFLQIRMFPNHPGIRFERRIHEQIIFSLAKLGLHVIHTDAVIWHMGYEKEEDRRAKSLRNLDLLLSEPDRGVDPVISTQLGDAYSILGRHDEAIAAYREVLDIPNSRQVNPDSYREVFIAIGKAYQHKHEYPEAIRWLELAEAENPGRLDPMFYKAESFMRISRFDEAEQLFKRALTLEKQNSTQASHWDVMRMYSYKYLCDIGVARNDLSMIITWARRFSAEYPIVVEAFIYLGKALLAQGAHLEAITNLETAVTTNATASRDAWHALVLAYERAGDAAKVEVTRDRMAKAFGDSVTQQGAPLLSIAMIVKNEEANLQGCLDSVKGLWDDLLVVDTGSSDRTVQIAEAAGARLKSFAWCDDFAAARNASLADCRGKWILWLDADDRVLPEDVARIRKLVASNPTPKAYGFMVKNSQDGGISGAVFNQVRLFPNRTDIRFEGRVHEQVMPAIQALGLPVEFLDIRIMHTGYTDPETVKTKQRRNLSIMLRDLELSGQKVNAMKLFAVGNAYLDLGQYADAEEWYRKAMQQAERVGEDRHILEILPVKIAECRANAGAKLEALAMMDAFVGLNPLQPNGLYLHAQLSEALGNLEAAVKEYGQVVHFQERPVLMPVDFQQVRVRACRFLADYWNGIGQGELAIEILRMGVAIGKGQTVSGLKLPALYFEHGQFEACRDSLQFARLLEENAVVVLSLAKALIMLDDVRGALEVLASGVRKYPADTELSQLFRDLRADLGV